MKNPHVLLLLLSAGLLAACSKQEPAPEPVRSVRTMTVAADSAGGVHEFAGEVRARTESRLGFRVAGKMVRRQAEVGQHVKAGAVLAELDPADLRLQQTAATAAVQSAQVNLDLAQADYKRYKDLRDQGFISSAELERRDTTLKAAQAQLDQARAQASVQGNQAAYSTLTASVPGVITAVDAEPGAVLASGASVVRLAHDGPRDAVFAVPEDAAAGVRALLGKSGGLRVRPWGTAKTLPATVREVAAAADPTTRTFLVKADLAGADLQLGQTATVLLDLPRMNGIARLPLTAVTELQGKTAVWLVDRNSMTVQMQPIAVAGADGNTVVVAGGLRPGQVVVTAGVHVLSPGQKVKFFEAPVAAAAPASAGR
jgi:RND family efflux transporter MFP subunit